MLRFDVNVGMSRRVTAWALRVPADLRPAWNWNVKQIFVYVTVEYATPEHVIPCAALRRAERCATAYQSSHDLGSYCYAEVNGDAGQATGTPPLPTPLSSDRSQVLCKYSLFDHGFGLRGNKISLRLNWYIPPLLTATL